MDLFGAYARFYDLDYANLDDDVPMILQFALRCGSLILELGCGTGRLLLPLARGRIQGDRGGCFGSHALGGTE